MQQVNSSVENSFSKLSSPNLPVFPKKIKFSLDFTELSRNFYKALVYPIQLVQIKISLSHSLHFHFDEFESHGILKGTKQKFFALSKKQISETENIFLCSGEERRRENLNHPTNIFSISIDVSN